jgi:hypothetical protein
MFLPITAIPEEELKTIVGPECYGAWARSSQCANTMSYFTNLKQNHDNRVRAAKK